MRMLGVSAIVAIAACTRPPRLQIFPVEIREGERPARDTVIVLTCPPRTYTHLTDERGRASLKIGAEEVASRCTVLAGKPGFKTLAARPTIFCATTCPPLALDLEPVEGSP